MKIKVLFIDDEPNNLTAFKASFRRDFDVFTANSAQEGMNVLEAEEIHVLLTDQRMPGTTGVQFLEQVIEKYPNPVRILVTGYADIEAVVDAINKGQVFRYISKPWNDDEIRLAIENAFKIYQHREERNFFVYKATHDLKGPLVSIRGLVNLVKRELSANNEINQYIDLIDDSIEHLDGTLSELIEYKRIGESQVNLSDVDFDFLVKDILKSIDRIDNYEKNEITVDIQQFDTFKSDSSILKSILTNIIQNAIKYGRYGNNNATINIFIGLDAGKVNIVIKDNGLGMTPEVKENIFKMFFRGASGVKGTGLGLYIVKTGIEKLDGSIEVDSEPGVGSEFRIQIPAYVSELVNS